MVDNKSSDGGLPGVKKDFPRFSYLELDENRGFAAGNNAGIEMARGRAILLLNPDTEVDRDTLRILYDILMGDEQAGIAGPKIFYQDGSMQVEFLPKSIPGLRLMFYEMFFLGKLFPGSRKLNAYYGSRATFDYDRQQYLEQVSGACLMIKKEVVDRIGLMDDNFFMYFEETDWCFRALKEG